MSKEKRRVPKLRFPGFTEDWEQRKLGDIVDFLDGQRKPLKESERTKGKYPYYGASGIIDYINDYLFDENLVLLSEDGANIIDRNYPVCFIATGKYWVNNHAHVLKVKTGVIDKFICETLERLDYTKFNTGTAQPKLNQDICQKIVITIPNEDEQKCISEFLDRINNIITLHQRKLEHLNLKKKALLQKLFPKNGERYPELRFPGFTDAWEQRKLGDIATFSKGNGYSKSDLVPSGSPIILYGRLYTNYETTIKNVDTFVKLKDKSVISHGGEVIVPASGETAEDISRASVVKNQGIIIGGDLNVIKANHLLDPTFLALTISNGEQQKELSKRAQGKSVVHLHNSDLQEVNLIFPLLNEQKEISTLFEKMDNIITLHQRKLEHLQLQKKALLQQMFV